MVVKVFHVLPRQFYWVLSLVISLVAVFAIFPMADVTLPGLLIRVLVGIAVGVLLAWIFCKTGA